MPPSPHERLIVYLATLAPLGEREREAVRTLPLRLRETPARNDIVHEGERSDGACLVLSGLVFRYKTLAQERRQILSLHFAGEVPDLESLYRDRLDHSIAALTRAETASIPHAALRALMHAHRGFADAVVRALLVDAAIYRAWLANIGRRSAYARVAHLFCEVFARMRKLGLADADSFRLPMTQTEIADANGLSSVHVNRVLQKLRREGLIASKGDVHEIADRAALAQVAGFDPRYLDGASEA